MRMPTCRPSSVSFILPMSCSAGDGVQVEHRAPPPAGAFGSGLSARPRRPAWPGPRRCAAGGRPSPARMCRCATLESSNTSADARCACSCAVWLTVELPRLAVVVGEGLGADAPLLAGLRDGGGDEASRRRLPRRVLVQGVRLVGDAALGLCHLHVPVALVVAERALGRVDRELVEVHRPQPRELRVEVREQPALQQGVVREVDAGHDVGRGRTRPARSRRRSCRASGRAPSGRSP